MNPRLITPFNLAFCTTGEGGGKDNSCSPKGDKGKSLRSKKDRRSKAVQWMAEGMAKVAFDLDNEINKLDTWMYSNDGEYEIQFELKDGREYYVRAQPFLDYGEEEEELDEDELDEEDADEGIEFTFGDVEEPEEMGITGAGAAFEIFSKVVPATAAYIRHERPKVVTFSAAYESRIKLYDRFVKTLVAKFPKYKATKEIYTSGQVTRAFWKLTRD